MVTWFENTETDVLGLDTETSGLKIYDKDFRLRMVQIGDDTHGWAVPYHLWGGAVLELMQEWDSRNGLWTLHNVAYDYKVLKEKAGYLLPWRNVHDTMIMHKVIDSSARAGLKDLTDRYIDPRASMGEEALKKAFKDGHYTWDTIPIDHPDYSFYSALDPVLAINLYRELRPEVEKYSNVYDLEMSVLRVLVGAEDRGMRVDLDYAKRMSEEYTDMVEANEVYAEGRWGININSTPQLQDKLTEMGAEFSVFTPKGAPSVNQEQLERFSKTTKNDDVRELSDFVVKTRKIAKMNSSYFKNFIEMEQDGILHPSINTLAARTGRMSITNPALQTLHSSDSVIRNSFLPRNEGEILVSCDYSQLELRLMAIQSGDKALIEAFREADATGGDFFVEVGKTAYGEPDFQKSDPRRKKLKGFMYSFLYGASVEKMAKNLGVPLEEMKDTAAKIGESFPGINEFMKNTINEVEDLERQGFEGFITLPSGRKLPVDNGKAYTGVNFKLQGFGAELLKIAIMRLDSAGLGEFIQVPIHDEVVFSIPEHRIDEFFPIIEDCMSFNSGEFPIDLVAEPEVLGHRWGEAYEKEG